MASSQDADLTSFFADVQSHGGIIVRDQPRFDLELYIQNYTGQTRYSRLLLIGSSCVPLCVDALKAAVVEAKNGSDVTRYKEAWQLIRQAAPGAPEAVRDEAWIEKTEWANKAETSRLETELKGYRNNLIKESIRMGNEDLGKHLEKIGRLPEATEAYSRMRQDVSHNKHIVDCTMHLIDLALRRRDWSVILNNMAKITNNVAEQDHALPCLADLLAGIASLGLENFEDAARSFLQMRGDVSPAAYSHIASPNDVATYGGLLALATMTRDQLHDVLHNADFRPILDHEPIVRKAIGSFYNGRYSDCLSSLQALRTDYLLDIYLQKHVSKIFSMIRSRCIVHYFTPFSCVTLSSLSNAFSSTEVAMETELVDMIRNGSLNARIDARNKLLVAVRPDVRLQLQHDALKVARKYEQEAQERLRRISIVAAGLEVSGNKRLNLGSGDESGQAFTVETDL